MSEETKEFKAYGNELDWLGQKDESKYLTYHGQSDRAQKRWYFTGDILELDPDYSEWSIRIHDPRCRSLSFIDRTLAILPKSRLRAIANLIERYLNEN